MFITRKIIIFNILFAFELFLVQSVKAQTVNEFQKLLASDGASDNSFGNSIDIDGNYAIVGADGYNDYQGKAYIFKSNDGIWTETVVLNPDNGLSGDGFGISVNIQGNYAIIGAHGVDDNGTQSGAAYIFKRTGEDWNEITKLYPSDAFESQKFGIQVCLTEQFAAITALEDEELGAFTGSVYIFERDGETYTETARLIPEDQMQMNWFGMSIDLFDNCLIVGAPWQDNQGAAYIFEYIDESWTQTAKLTASDYEGNDNLGYSVAVNEQYAILGALYQNETTGAAYLYKKPETGWADMTESVKLTASDGAEDDKFGRSVDISNEYALVGASAQYAQQRTGSLYLFRNEGDVWEECCIFKASDGEDDDRLGFSCKLSGDTAFAGAISDDDNGYNAGAVYVFKPDESGINEVNDYQLSVFPSPTTDIIKLYSPVEQYKVSLYNITGKKITEELLSGKENQLNILSLPKGIYIIEVSTQQGVYSKKIIKE